MVARCKVDLTPLAVTFARAGEEPVHVEAADGWKALLVIVNRLLERGHVRPGDRITVEAATDR